MLCVMQPHRVVLLKCTLRRATILHAVALSRRLTALLLSLSDRTLITSHMLCSCYHVTKPYRVTSTERTFVQLICCIIVTISRRSAGRPFGTHPQTLFMFMCRMCYNAILFRGVFSSEPSLHHAHVLHVVAKSRTPAGSVPRN